MNHALTVQKDSARTYPASARRRTTRLKVALVERGLVQAEVARTTGIGETRLSRIVNGRVEPRDDEIGRLAHTLGMERDELAL